MSEPIKLEVGKSYRARNGEKWTNCREIPGGDGNFLPRGYSHFLTNLHGSEFAFMPDGKSRICGTESVYDIIAEWSEPQPETYTERRDRELAESDARIKRSEAWQSRINTGEAFLDSCGGNYEVAKSVLDALELLGQ